MSPLQNANGNGIFAPKSPAELMFLSCFFVIVSEIRFSAVDENHLGLL